jgi:hypothetical protein
MAGVSAMATVTIITRMNTQAACPAPDRLARNVSTAATNVNTSKCSGKNSASAPNLPGPSQRTGLTMQYASPAMSRASTQPRSSHAIAPYRLMVVASAMHSCRRVRLV